MNLAHIRSTLRRRWVVTPDGILALCIAGSLGLHVLFYGWFVPKRGLRSARTPADYIVIESWPAGVQEPTSKAEPTRPSEPATRKAREKVAPPPSQQRSSPDPTSVVQKTGILRALGALDPARLASMGGHGELGGLPVTVPSASRGEPGVEPAPGRKGGDLRGPATLGDVKAVRLGGAVGIGQRDEPKAAVSVEVGVMESSTGPIDRRRLAAFVRDRVGGLRACYEAELRGNPRLEGRIRVRFTVLETGGLSQIVATENTLGSIDVADCLVRIMRSWRTPFRVSEVVSVEYPFVFSSSRG